MCFIVKYHDVWEKELINHFGENIAECARRCGVQRTMLHASLNKENGYISDTAFDKVCQKMNLSPLCFLDDSEEHPFHSAYYNSHYKMTYAEYKALAYKASHAAFYRQSLERQRQCNLDDYLIDHTLKLYTGLSDQELDQLDSKTKFQLQLSITSAINKILSESLPTWN